VLEQHLDRVSSALARVEVQRALSRAGASRAVQARGEAVLASLVLVQIDDLVLSRAAGFTDAALRSLDAIHLASALSLGDDPDAFIARAVEAGAAGAVDEIRDHQMPWGVHRQGGFIDPFGHRWQVGDRSPLRRHP